METGLALRVNAAIDIADTAIRIPSFTAPAYLVTESYGGKVLDSFSIKLLNRFTYLPETQAPELFEQALAINVAVFTVSGAAFTRSAKPVSKAV